MTDAGLPSLPCAAHTLQLVVHEGLLSQKSVADAVAVGRKIVGHFMHSDLAYSRLEDIQLQINQPTKRLQQDVQTRWNSTFYMIQSLVEQKRALGIYEYDLPDNLITSQWTLLEKTASVLGPFEELTRRVSSSDAMAADVIPAITVLRRFLSRETEEDDGIKTKGTLSAAVMKRFCDVEGNLLYSLATLLDPSVSGVVGERSMGRALFHTHVRERVPRRSAGAVGCAYSSPLFSEPVPMTTSYLGSAPHSGEVLKQSATPDPAPVRLRTPGWYSCIVGRS
ncbi:hypothetical protein COCON_G00199300 [Conger conger]|uniref:Zinc finger BED domain-containing protein 4 n=1 Tax=Conger conger TaxID=82655 RepID=A0A9Q1HPJ1_CONCO|nr:hypothetical protein COCON_G00199300 [Conger conger]